jgi:tetratricopeptide (TPR) repeat protein
MAFGRIAGNDFINFDDHEYITENAIVQSGLNADNIKKAFTTVVVSNWVPLAIISQTLDWSVFGANPAGHHLMSLFFHIGAVILLFLFLYKTTNHLWSSAFAAAFFALHPLRVESVAWASERKDVLSMFFGMATLYAYAFYAGSSRWRSYAICLLLFTLGLLSKSILVTLPFVLLLLDYWPLNRWDKTLLIAKKKLLVPSGRLIIEKIPFFLLGATLSVVTFLVQHDKGVVYPPLWERLCNAVVAYVVYLKKMVWPFDLALFYFTPVSFPLWQVMGSGFILFLITAAALYVFKKMPYVFMGWFWYLGTLVPMIGLVPTSTWVADHYTYLPSVGMAIMLAWGIRDALKMAGWQHLNRKVLWPVGLGVLILLAFLSFRQCGFWKNSVSLWNYTVNATKDNSHAHLLLGYGYADSGQYEQAMTQFDKAIRLKPNDFVAYNGRGVIYSLHGLYENAVDNFNRAIRLQPLYVPAYYNRGKIYNNLELYQPALDDLNHAIRLNLFYPEAILNKKNKAPAIQGTSTPPEFIMHNDRGILYGKLSQYEKAVDDFSQAIDLNPAYFMAFNNRGFAYAALGKYQNAIEDYNQAIKLQPDYAMAFHNRALAHFKLRNINKGCDDASKACRSGICEAWKEAQAKRLCR